jgi:hypothetical protein
MGSQSFTTYSRGKNVKDAYNRAVERAEETYGHQEGYSGQINSSAGYRDVTKEWKASKLSMEAYMEKELDRLTKHQGAQAICIEEPKENTNKVKSQVEHIVTPGTKKWILKYEVEDREGSVISSAVSKGDAVKMARAYTEKHQRSTKVIMRKVLEKTNPVVANVSYKRSSQEKEGRWVFFGWASC